MSRARTKQDASPAGRIATSRRADRGARADRAPPKKAAAPAGKARGRGKKGAPASPIARFFKLCVLLGFMAMLGFGIVLVVDVGLTVLGGIHLGSITFAELVDKVEARVFDRDVPEPLKKKPEAATPAKPKPRAKPQPSSSPTPEPVAAEERAELPAPPPNDYGKAVAPRTDVEVVEARARLDRLLKGL
ncbi:MAG TPA: hypothetical protein VGF99_03855 [Myxococcota bacterium]